MSEIVSGEPSEGMDAAEDLDADKFGMWDGVFARCLLNIFGVIMFLRVPWMVAYAGVLNSLLIIIVSVVITTISATSLQYHQWPRCRRWSLLPDQQVAWTGIWRRDWHHVFCSKCCRSAHVFDWVCKTIVNMAGGETIMVEGWDLRIISFISLAFITIICFAGLKYVVKFRSCCWHCLCFPSLPLLSVSSFPIPNFLPIMMASLPTSLARISCQTGIVNMLLRL